MILKMANDVHWFKALHSKFSNCQEPFVQTLLDDRTAHGLLF